MCAHAHRSRDLLGRRQAPAWLPFRRSVPVGLARAAKAAAHGGTAAGAPPLPPAAAACLPCPTARPPAAALSALPDPELACERTVSTAGLPARRVVRPPSHASEGANRLHRRRPGEQSRLRRPASSPQRGRPAPLPASSLWAAATSAPLAYPPAPCRSASARHHPHTHLQMGEALIRGFLASGISTAGKVCVSVKTLERRQVRL